MSVVEIAEAAVEAVIARVTDAVALAVAFGLGAAEEDAAD